MVLNFPLAIVLTCPGRRPLTTGAWFCMSQSRQCRNNVFYVTRATRTACRGRCDQVNDRHDPDLPLDNPKRWTARRKAAVILAIRNKGISIWEACERYDLSADELAEWERDLDQFGVPGLRTTKIQNYRKAPTQK